METIRVFTDAQTARDYRYQHGTGGWIFAPEQGQCVLFPPDYTPTKIFHHPMTKGQSGRLLAN